MKEGRWHGCATLIGAKACTCEHIHQVLMVDGKGSVRGVAIGAAVVERTSAEERKSCPTSIARMGLVEALRAKNGNSAVEPFRPRSNRFVTGIGVTESPQMARHSVKRHRSCVQSKLARKKGSRSRIQKSSKIGTRALGFRARVRNRSKDSAGTVWAAVWAWCGHSMGTHVGTHLACRD